MKRKRMKQFLFLFSFFFLFSFIIEPFSNVHADTKKNAFSTEDSKDKTGLKGNPGDITQPAFSTNPTTAQQPATNPGSGVNSPGSNPTTAKQNPTTQKPSSSSTTATKKDDSKVSDEGRDYPADIDKSLEKVCYDMVRGTLNVTLGSDMKEVITGNTTNKMMDDMQDTYKSIVSPVGLALVTLYFLIELIDKTTKDNFSLEHFFKLMLKIVVAKLLIENGWDILNGCVNIGNNLAEAIVTSPKDVSSTKKLLDEYAKEIAEDNPLGNLGMIVQFLIPWIASWISKTICIVICWGRMIEIGVRATIAPIAMADIFSDGTHSGGFRYLRKFLAVCLQAAVIMVIIQISGIIQTLIIGNDTITMFKAVVVGLSTLMMVIRSQQFASDLTGA